jgi:hypothetical protein
MTAALEQAAHDKHLLLGAQRSGHIELRYPEYVTISYSFGGWEGGGSGRMGTSFVLARPSAGIALDSMPFWR